MHKRVSAILVSQDGQQSYNVLFDHEFNQVRADEESEPLGRGGVKRRIVPGHDVPDGNYILQPYEFQPEPIKVHLEDGHMKPGWR